MLTPAGLRFSVTAAIAPLNDLVRVMQRAASGIHVLRDATRGGLAAVLNEIATASATGIMINETAIPVHESAGCQRDAGSRLSMPPTKVNRGNCFPENADAVLTAMRNHTWEQRQKIGRVTPTTGKVNARYSAPAHPGYASRCSCRASATGTSALRNHAISYSTANYLWRYHGDTSRSCDRPIQQILSWQVCLLTVRQTANGSIQPVPAGECCAR